MRDVETVRRRQILFGLIGAGALGAWSARAEERAAAGAFDWEGFLKECLPRARELVKDSSPRGTDAYLQFVASVAVRLPKETIPPAKLGSFASLEPPVSFGVGYKGDPFFVVEWRMAPGAVLPPHGHPNASVCTIGLEGEAVLCNYEIAGVAPSFRSRESFRVRQTHEELIGPGRLNTLSPTRDNVHTFRAGPKGARGIDISTYHGPNIGFSFLALGAAADEGGRVRTATWTEI